MRNQRLYFDHPAHVVSVAVAFPVISIIFVSLRFWARKVQKQPLKADDWLIVLATLLTVGLGITQLYGVYTGALAYPTQIPPGYTGRVSGLHTTQLIIKSQIEWAYAQMFVLALGCIKASFLFFYMRVFAIEKKSFVSKLLTGLIIFEAVWTAALYLSVLFECGHRFWFIWSSDDEYTTHCIRTHPRYFTLCIIDIITDIAIISIPIPLVLRLNLSRSRKIAVSSVFLLGGGSFFASLIRFVMTAGNLVGGNNITYDNIIGATGSAYWATVECGVGVMAACLPTVQFVIRKRFTEWSACNRKDGFGSRSTDPGGHVAHSNRSAEVAFAKMDTCPNLPASLVYPASIWTEESIGKENFAWDERILDMTR
ncbi:hypothetical protein GGS23DRAFT_585427 [Durotheca rogersii]|uniref:uncharacterized protein n=1 Tax=Durotheca rogersii TaxID=419775 RepID=UPI00221EEC0B|nr:uncharacterized protein GGS23DRAFT_585427 [Durotheca rogersii]KAI5859443.1 hypothetical protein GGS23DRAFT_585427 [Durotheca rogersii]